jgi:hypothetical protein
MTPLWNLVYLPTPYLPTPKPYLFTPSLTTTTPIQAPRTQPKPRITDHRCIHLLASVIRLRIGPPPCRSLLRRLSPVWVPLLSCLSHFRHLGAKPKPSLYTQSQTPTVAASTTTYSEGCRVDCCREGCCCMG